MLEYCRRSGHLIIPLTQRRQRSRSASTESEQSSKASDLIKAYGWKSESIAQFPWSEEKIQGGAAPECQDLFAEPLAAEPVDQKDIPHYWGYETEVVESLEDYLKSRAGLVRAHLQKRTAPDVRSSSRRSVEK